MRDQTPMTDNNVAELLDVAVDDLLKAKAKAKKFILDENLDLINMLSVEGYTNDEIAFYLGIPASAVRDYWNL